MAEGISISYKGFAKILKQKDVLNQIPKKVVNRHQKIIEAAIGEKLHWDGDCKEIKQVCSLFSNVT